MKPRLSRWTIVLSSLLFIGAMGVPGTSVQAASTESAASCLPVNSKGYYDAIDSSQAVEEFFTPTVSGRVSSVQLALGAKSYGSSIPPKALNVE